MLSISYPEQLATLFDFTDGRVTFVSAVKIIIKRARGLGSSLVQTLGSRLGKDSYIRDRVTPAKTHTHIRRSGPGVEGAKISSEFVRVFNFLSNRSRLLYYVIV